MQIRTIILGFGLLLFGGCVTKTTEVHSDSENPNQKPATAIHFTYKEHDYIKFQWYYDGYDSQCGYVHDPDCRKCKKENRELN